MTASPGPRAPLCQECAVELYGIDLIESEIAMGRLSFKSQRPVTNVEQLTMDDSTTVVGERPNLER